MQIKELFRNSKFEIIQGDDSTDIEYIAYNSKKVSKNSLFVCIRGFKVDGHDYIDEAIKNGAIAILVEAVPLDVPQNITVIKVENTRKTLPLIASVFYNEPSKYFNLVGITGTNGKTSVSFFVSKILNSNNHNVGLIGTIDSRINDRVLELTNLTTPESLDLQFIFRKMADEKVDDVIMETSSMALELYRVDYSYFDIGVFTNLTQDHLDNHKTMENYKNAKLRLFKMTEKAVINIDDEVSKEIMKIHNKKILTYGIYNDADIMAKDIKSSISGVKFNLVFNNKVREVKLQVPGFFSVYNALAAFGVCYLLGLTFDEIINGLQLIEGVRGRFETIRTKCEFSVIVDYAHTPDALENVLNTVKDFAEGKIITVFGCGGDRDKSKRPKMGKIAGELSDFCVITSDNPRNEDPLKILNDVEGGIKDTNCLYDKEIDRKMAIKKAIDIAKKGDIIIIAGKGHETYQILKDKVIEFDDVKVVKEYLNLKKY